MKKISFVTGILAGLAIASLLILFSVFLWNTVYPVPAAPIPVNAPADLAELATRVAALETEQAYQLKVLEWKLDQKVLVLGWSALVITFIGALLGLKTYIDLEKVIQDRVKAILEKQLYQLDTTNLSIWVISRDETQKLFDPKKREEETVNLKHEMDKVFERLELSGFPNVKSCEEMDHKNYRGVTIVPIFNGDMEKEFSRFVERNHNQLDKSRAAFVLYTQTHLVSKDTLKSYPNLATANMPATAASMVLTVGRGLFPTNTKKEVA